MIDKLFVDADRIAEKYESNSIDVIIEFTRFEYRELGKGLPFVYGIIIGKTEQHFKDKYYAHKRFKDILREMW